MSKVPALLKWIGNKQRFAETIISYMPEQFNNYYEPFLGSGAVMSQLLSQNSTTNTPIFAHSYASDILPFLIDIFNIVKYDPQQIKNYYSREIEEYYKTHPYEEKDFPQIHPLVVGVGVSREVRRERITQRLHARLQQGMVEEVVLC